MVDGNSQRVSPVGSELRGVKTIYTAAGVYGLLVLAPGFFTEAAFGRANPPAINHPEFYYGFFGSAVVWQLVFLMIGRNPVAFRHLAPVTILEKAAFFIPSVWLYSTGRLAVSGPMYGGLIDGVLMLAFLWATFRIRRAIG